MGYDVLGLDTILSAMFCFVDRWTPALSRNHSRDLLRFLLCRLYDQNRGNLFSARITLAQTTLAKKLGLSRQWVGELVHRLDEAGWLVHVCPKLPDGTNSPTMFMIGRQLKRVLVMLTKSKRRKKRPTKEAAKSTWHFSPSAEEKKQILIREKEKTPPKPELLARIPLLRQWLERGKG